MEHQSDVADTPTGYPLSTETSAMRLQPIQQQYGYPVSSAAHSLYTVAPATPISPTWPEQSTQYKGSTPQTGTAPSPAEIDKPKHVLNEVGGSAAASLRFRAGNKDDELAIMENDYLRAAEWWGCQIARGDEGVMPASYIEVCVVISSSSLFLDCFL